jgi:PrtD family type I secretion system ABC transporter
LSLLPDDHFLVPELPELRSATGALLFFSAVITTFYLIPSIFMLQVFERVMQSRNMSTLLFLALIVGVLTVIWTALEMIRQRVLAEVANSLDEKISTRVFDAVNRQSRVLSAQSRATIVQDLNVLRDFVAGNLPIQFMDLCFVPLVIIAVAFFHPLMGAALLLLTLVVLALSVWTQRAARQEVKRSLTATMKANEFARAVMGSAEASRVMGMLPRLSARWRGQVREALGWQQAATNQAALPSSCLRFLRHLYMPIMLCVGMLLFLNELVGPGIVFAATMVVGRAVQPVDSIANNWRGIWNAQMSLDRIDRLLREAGQRVEKVALPAPDGPLVVSRIVATPSDRDNVVLADISFVAKPGSITAVVGSSGAGKSSLAKVLVGAWGVRKGSITLDGHDLTHWDQDRLGRHIGYMPQDVLLLPGTLAENIARFEPADEERDRKIVEAVKVAGIQDIVTKLPEGLNTRVGPDGHTMSGGQRQRVALARAVYGEPQLVVLDEPNSNLDSLGEKGLADTLEMLRDQGVIVILITHRMNMLAYCDNVLVMTGGTVHAFGPRDVVLDRLSMASQTRQIAQRTSPAGESSVAAS